MKFHLLVPLTLALLLAIALAGTALANPPDGHGGPGGGGPSNQQQSNNGPQNGHGGPGGSGPGNQQQSNNGPGTGSGGPGGSGPGNLAPAPTATPTATPSSTAAHADARSTPSGDGIVSHAATPAQLCPISGGLQYYFIGADGSSQTGPYIKPFSELATLHTVGTSVRLYTGSNPFTGKSVHIDYLPADNKLRISTYYPDTMYDTDKPYTFTVDSGNSVTHEAW